VFVVRRELRNHKARTGHEGVVEVPITLPEEPGKETVTITPTEV